jgi:hypothetical protein
MTKARDLADNAEGTKTKAVDAKGDLIVGTAADTAARLAVGTDTYLLTADNSEVTGLKWAAAAAGGKVLQVVYANTATTVSNSTKTYADTGLTATITPTSASSQILIFVNQNGVKKGGTNNQVDFKIVRGATDIMLMGDIYAGLDANTPNIQGDSVGATYLDSPATTSATTYKTQFRSYNLGEVVTVQNNYAVTQTRSTITLMEIGA